MKLAARYAVPMLAGSLLLTGCGPLGSSKSAGPSASSSISPAAAQATAQKPATATGKLLAADATKLTKAGSAKISGTIVTKPAGTSAALTVQFAGAERWSPSQAGNLTLTGVHVGDATVGSVTMLLTSDALYLKLPMLSSVLHKQWAKLSFAKAASFGGVDLSQLSGQAQQLQPGQYLQMLTRSTNVKAVGKATVDGVATRHYAGTVDLQKALESLPDIPSVWSKLASTEGAKTVHVDAWIDAQNRPRKLTVVVASTVAALTLTLHLSDFGVKVTVTPPSSAQTLDLTHGLLGAIG